MAKRGRPPGTLKRAVRTLREDAIHIALQAIQELSGRGVPNLWRIASRIANEETDALVNYDRVSFFGVADDVSVNGIHPQDNIDQYMYRRYAGTHSNKNKAYSTDEGQWVRETSGIVLVTLMSKTPALSLASAQRLVSQFQWPASVARKLVLFAAALHDAGWLDKAREMQVPSPTGPGTLN
jgi:hypothetical protein